MDPSLAVVSSATLVISYLLFKLVDKMLGLRVPNEEETEGLDITQHDERGYTL